MTPDRVQLVRDALADSPGGLDRLVTHWLPVVLRWCIRLGGSGVNAEDAAQEAFETMFERLPSLRQPDAFPAWMYGITRRVLARHRRRAWIRRWVPGLVVDTPDSSFDPERASSQAQIADRVWTAMGRVPLHHREVLVLCDLEERPDSEVAELLGVPKATVKSRLRRAREALRAELGDLQAAVMTATDLGET
jgi:RNA polymerase sigma-70 factor (ECF subfamily)